MSRVTDDMARHFWAAHENEISKVRCDSSAQIELRAVVLAQVYDDSRAECERLRAKLAEAVEACKPFANEAKLWGQGVRDAEPIYLANIDTEPVLAEMTLGDLRRAARVVDGAK